MTLPIHEKAASGVLCNALVGDVSGARDSKRSGRKMPTLFSCVKCGELPHVKEVLTGASYPYDVRKEVRCQCGAAAMYFEPHEEIRAYGRWNKKQRLGVGGEKTPRLEADSSPTYRLSEE